MHNNKPVSYGVTDLFTVEPLDGFNGGHENNLETGLRFAWRIPIKLSSKQVEKSPASYLFNFSGRKVPIDRDLLIYPFILRLKINLE